MNVESSSTLLHWNYFLALESDLDTLSRYIEFDPRNDPTFSIELAHLLLAASSEVDVLLKKLCKAVSPDQKVSTIADYKRVIKTSVPGFAEEEVFIPRFGRSYKPWKNFGDDKTPLWWTSFNHVKHKRDTHFHEANLRNVLHAMGGLLAVNFYYYKTALNFASLKAVGEKLSPTSALLQLNPSYYLVLMAFE